VILLAVGDRLLRYLSTAFWLSLTLLNTAAVKADVPMALERLMTDGKGTTKLNLALTYNNSGSGTLQNTDVVIKSLILRHGLTDQADIYGRGNYIHSQERISYHKKYKHSLQNVWLGASYKFKPDNATPALIGFVETAFEKGRKDSRVFKSWVAGITTYKAIDPIVLIMSGYYSLNLPRKYDHDAINPGNTLALNPSIAFTANDRVTLNMGVNWTNAWPYRTNNRKRSRITSTDLQLGVDYGFSDEDILNVTLASNVSGVQGTSLRFDWLHTF